jgi:hypothetical protein
LKIVQRWGGGIHMNKGRVQEDRGSKETDRCPLTVTADEAMTVIKERMKVRSRGNLKERIPR